MAEDASLLADHSRKVGTKFATNSFICVIVSIEVSFLSLVN